MKPTNTIAATDTTIRVLILEDESDHAFVLQHRLRRDLGDCAFELVSDEASFIEAITRFAPQVVLADNSLIGFNAEKALHVARMHLPSSVCILVTANLLEQQAVNFIREGGDDCIVKDQLSRLSTVIRIALARKQRAEAPSKAELYEARRMDIYQSYTELSPDGMLFLDERGYIIHANDTAGRLLSGKSWAPTGNLLWEVFPATKGSFFEAAFHAVLRDNQTASVRLYLPVSECWLDCFFYPLANGVSILVRDVNGEEQLRRQVRELQHRFDNELSAVAEVAKQQERHALGKELHDNVNQLLASANLFLTVINASPERAPELVSFCTSSIQQAIEENRRIASGLVASQGQPLLPRVQQLCETMFQPANISFDIDTEGFIETSLSKVLQLTLYRILQEQFVNIVKHAEASKVSLHFSMQNNQVRVVVADNGKGTSLTKRCGGIGLGNIAGRVAESGGEMRIDTSPGNGFVLEIMVPIA